MTHANSAWERGAGFAAWLKPLSLAAAIAVISYLHYATHTSHVIQHEIFRHLYYLPILFAAYWYGPWGGLTTALVASLAYIPHIHGAWAPNVPYAVSQYAQLIVFLVIGFSVGLLVSFQRTLTIQYRDAAASLEQANRELRDSQEELRRADRLSALGEVAAALAHEIRNPLASVKGALEILTSRVEEGSPEAEFAGIAAKELARLDDLVTEFLTYARPRNPELRDADLHDVIRHVMILLQPEAERAAVIVELDRRDALPHVSIDAQQIGQVFFNVVLNAIQASPAGGHVGIRESLTPDFAVVDVIDEGPGVAREHRARIFDPFFTTKARGTGLGLAISSRIVTAHGGTIEAQPGAGSGTRMSIRLPLSSGARKEAPGRAATASI